MQTHNQGAQLQGNLKNYTRNMQILNDIKGRLPINQPGILSDNSGLVSPEINQSTYPKLPFEEHTLVERDLARNLQIMLNTR